MKKTGAKALFAAAAFLAFADGGFACENCPDDKPAAATVSLSGGGVAHRYSRLLFGYFIEHFDTVVYGGICDPASPLSDEDGFRRDVNKSPGEAVELDVSAPYPGGTDFLPATILSGDSPDGYNDVGSENHVVPQKVRLAVADGKTTLRPHSVAAIVLADNP